MGEPRASQVASGQQLSRTPSVLGLMQQDWDNAADDERSSSGALLQGLCTPRSAGRSRWETLRLLHRKHTLAKEAAQRRQPHKKSLGRSLSAQSLERPDVPQFPTKLVRADSAPSSTTTALGDLQPFLARPLNAAARRAATGPTTACIADLEPEYADDPLLMHGRLGNGLRYFVRPNKYPNQEIQLWAVVNAGSLNETEEERGLAHVVEVCALKLCTVRR